MKPFGPVSVFGRLDFSTKHIEVSSLNLSYYFWRSCSSRSPRDSRAPNWSSGEHRRSRARAGYRGDGAHTRTSAATDGDSDRHRSSRRFLPRRDRSGLTRRPRDPVCAPPSYAHCQHDCHSALCCVLLQRAPWRRVLHRRNGHDGATRRRAPQTRTTTPAPHETRPVLAANQVLIFVYGCIRGSTTKKIYPPRAHIRKEHPRIKRAHRR